MFKSSTVLAFLDNARAKQFVTSQSFHKHCIIKNRCNRKKVVCTCSVSLSVLTVVIQEEESHAHNGKAFGIAARTRNGKRLYPFTIPSVNPAAKLPDKGR